jgi:hypothetical protein
MLYINTPKRLVTVPMPPTENMETCHISPEQLNTITSASKANEIPGDILEHKSSPGPITYHTRTPSNWMDATPTTMMDKNPGIGIDSSVSEKAAA